jgi:hypothetical protein
MRKLSYEQVTLYNFAENRYYNFYLAVIPLLLKERFFNNITNRTFIICSLNAQVPNVKVCRYELLYKWICAYSLND